MNGERKRCTRRVALGALLVTAFVAFANQVAFAQVDPLPSWNDGPVKTSIIDFVARAGEGARFAGLVHHTDAEREYAYDRQSKVGKLDKALDEATAKGWAVADMKRDWKTVFPFEK
jgi:hypothetical protein